MKKIISLLVYLAGFFGSLAHAQVIINSNCGNIRVERQGDMAYLFIPVCGDSIYSGIGHHYSFNRVYSINCTGFHFSDYACISICKSGFYTERDRDSYKTTFQPDPGRLWISGVETDSYSETTYQKEGMIIKATDTLITEPENSKNYSLIGLSLILLVFGGGIFILFITEDWKRDLEFTYVMTWIWLIFEFVFVCFSVIEYSNRFSTNQVLSFCLSLIIGIFVLISEEYDKWRIWKRQELDNISNMFFGFIGILLGMYVFAGDYRVFYYSGVVFIIPAILMVIIGLIHWVILSIKKKIPKKEKIVVMDINQATQEDLMKIYGIGEGLSLRILKQKELLIQYQI